MEHSEQNLLHLLRAGDACAFEVLFKAHFKSLHSYATSILQDRSMAEEMVQVVFYKIWERKNKLNIHTSLKSFLYRAVHNECITQLSRRRQEAAYRTHVLQTQEQQTHALISTNGVESSELAHRLQKAISELPQQCSLVFCLSRFENLKYADIAEKLGISIKTVEAQMTKAMKLLKIKLGLSQTVRD